MTLELSTAAPCRRLREERLQAVRSKLVTDNEALVHWILRRFFSMTEEKTYDYNDAAQEARGAMVHASNRFDPDLPAESTGKPVKFGTFATTVILRHMITWRNKRARNGFTHVGDSHHNEVRTYSKMPISIERAFGRTEADRPIEETVRELSVEYDLDTSVQYAECLKTAKGALGQRHYYVLLQCTFYGRSHSDVAREMRISKERVRQMIKEAVTKIRLKIGLDPSMAIKTSWK